MIIHIKKFLPEIVYGGIDGIVTTFAIVAGVAGAGLSPSVIFVLGLANVLADGFSMGTSKYLSEESVISTPDMAPNSTRHNSLREGIVTFVAFVTLGSIPLIPFLVGILDGGISEVLLLKISVVVTAILFIAVGYARGILTHRNYIITAWETLMLGAVASLIAFGVGRMLGNII